MPNRLAACFGQCFGASASNSHEVTTGATLQPEDDATPQAGGAAAALHGVAGAAGVAGVAQVNGGALPSDTSSVLLAIERLLGACSAWPKSPAIGELMRGGRDIQFDAARSALPTALLLERYKYWSGDVQRYLDMWAKLPTLNHYELQRLEALDIGHLSAECKSLVNEQTVHARHECEEALKAFGDQRFVAAQAAHDRAAQHVRVARAIAQFAPSVSAAIHANWSRLADRGRAAGTYAALEQVLEAVAQQQQIPSFRTRFLSAGQESQLSTGFYPEATPPSWHREEKPRKQLQTLREDAASLPRRWNLAETTRALSQYLERQLPRGGRDMPAPHRDLMNALQAQSSVARNVLMLVESAELTARRMAKDLSALIPGTNFRADIARELHAQMSQAYEREDFEVIDKGHERLMALSLACQAHALRPADWTTLERNAEHRQNLMQQARRWTDGDASRLTLLQRCLVSEFKKAARYMEASEDVQVESRLLYEMEELLNRLRLEAPAPHPTLAASASAAFA